jgi:hypothetical protein
LTLGAFKLPDRSSLAWPRRAHTVVPAQNPRSRGLCGLSACGRVATSLTSRYSSNAVTENRACLRRAVRDPSSGLPSTLPGPRQRNLAARWRRQGWRHACAQALDHGHRMRVFDRLDGLPLWTCAEDGGIQTRAPRARSKHIGDEKPRSPSARADLAAPRTLATTGERADATN